MSEQDFRVPPSGPTPLPTPEHQRKITGNKWFEVITVVLMIVVGFGYLAWRNSGGISDGDPARTLGESAHRIELDGAVQAENTLVFGRHLLSYTQNAGIFERHIDLVGTDLKSPLETAIIWLTPNSGDWKPTDQSLLDAVNGVGELGRRLVVSSSDALAKAVNTMEFIKDSERPHDKGVAATTDGWKITYVTYHGFDEHADPQPVLYFVLQRMSAGEDDALGVFNRTLYEAIQRGDDAVAAVRAAGSQAG